MKVNYIAVLPSIVRYDRLLSSTSILLWAEISASADEYGISVANNETLAGLLNVDQRTVIRCLNQLVDNGHIVRMEDKFKRKLKVVIKPIALPENTTIQPAEDVNYEDVKAFTINCLQMWELKLDTVVENKESFIPIFKKYLKTFGEEEILKAINSRINHVTHSEWHLKPENHDVKVDLMAILESDVTLLRWIK